MPGWGAARSDGWHPNLVAQGAIPKHSPAAHRWLPPKSCVPGSQPQALSSSSLCCPRGGHRDTKQGFRISPPCSTGNRSPGWESCPKPGTFASASYSHAHLKLELVTLALLSPHSAIGGARRRCQCCCQRPFPRAAALFLPCWLGPDLPGSATHNGEGPARPPSVWRAQRQPPAGAQGVAVPRPSADTSPFQPPGHGSEVVA